MDGRLLISKLITEIGGPPVTGTPVGSRTVVSPPAFLWDPYLTLTNVILDLDICGL